MSSKGWRRFLPGKRRNRREDQVIRAIPISEAGPVLHEDESDPEMPEHDPYLTQQQYVSQIPLLPPYPNACYDLLLLVIL